MAVGLESGGEGMATALQVYCDAPAPPSRTRVAHGAPPSSRGTLTMTLTLRSPSRGTNVVATQRPPGGKSSDHL